MSIFFYGKENYPTDKRTYLEKYQLHLSENFMICIDRQIRKDFKKKTGYPITPKVGLSVAIGDLLYVKDHVSHFTQKLFVDHNWIPVTIAWKSKSGRIYEPKDEDIDCNDLEAWFNELDVDLIKGILSKKHQLPFNTDDLNFKLRVAGLNVFCIMEMKLKAGHNCDTQLAIDKIEKFIDDYNTHSESNDWEFGAVHNWKGRLSKNKLVFEIDLGSAGPDFYEKLLSFLSDMDCFSGVDIA